MRMNQSIGILDSGVGGLTVAKEIIRQLPRERIIYFGDNARCPYGPRSAEEIATFTNQMIHFLFQFELKALVIACNTAAAVVLEEVRERAGIPVLGVIEPGARAAISVSRAGRIGVIGTETTIRTEAYQRALRRINPYIYVSSLPCPPFVPLVEKRLHHSEEARMIIRDTLEPLRHEELDTLILGCTHYPLLAPLIEEVFEGNITLISSAEETARELSALLALKDALTPADQWDFPTHRFYTSGEPEVFSATGEEWLATEVEVLHHSLDGVYQS